jgi:hypothetical protein
VPDANSIRERAKRILIHAGFEVSHIKNLDTPELCVLADFVNQPKERIPMPRVSQSRQPLPHFVVRRTLLTDGSPVYDVVLVGDGDILNACSEGQAQAVARIMNDALDSADRYNAGDSASWTINRDQRERSETWKRPVQP